MDPSLLFNTEYLPIIIATLVGFGALAALLLVPVARFLDREQEVAEDWTPEAVAERLRERHQDATNGVEAPGGEAGIPKPEGKDPGPDR